MRKLRMAIMSLAAFSLFYTVFWYLFSVIYDHKYESSIGFLKNVKLPLAANIFIILLMFAITLVWYLYHKKDRTESVSNFAILAIYVIYLVLYIVGIVDIYHRTGGWGSEWNGFASGILLTSGICLVIAVVPLFMHFIASIYTGGFDNVGEPYNIYGFVYTTIGLCYIPFFLIINFTNQNSLLLKVFALNENGFMYTLIILTFILCAGLRFNAVTINIINIVMSFGIAIAWFVILLIHSDATYIYLCMLNLIMAIPQAILSIFILKHYIKVDRFYKGQTKNFLNE